MFNACIVPFIITKKNKYPGISDVSSFNGSLGAPRRLWALQLIDNWAINELPTFSCIRCYIIVDGKHVSVPRMCLNSVLNVLILQCKYRCCAVLLKNCY
jgi:hypothetical protein